MPNLRCERFGPFDVEELQEEIANLEFEYMMDLAPSKPPSVVRLCECKDEDYEGYHVRLFVGDYEYCIEEGNDAEEVKTMLEDQLTYETYAEQDLEGVPRFHNWYMSLPGKSPYDKHYIEECKRRADAFFKEKADRKKKEEEESQKKAASAASAAKPWSSTPEAERDTAVLFPGQGTQKVGMAGKLMENKQVAALFELASKVMGYDMVGLIAQGPQEKLDTTLYSQPAIFTFSLAAMEKAKQEAPEMLKKVKAAAGFSLGEYTALVFAGALSFEDGLKLVKARAEAMDTAAKAAAGGMASVSGVSDTVLQQALDKAAEQVGSGKKAYIANYMFPEGRTCSGDKEVLTKFCEVVLSMGAKQAKMLAVSGAFHTPYMGQASEALAKALALAEVTMPQIKVYSNVTGKPYESVEEIKDMLKRQMLEPVKWEQSMKHLITLGCNQYVEPGPGKQLKAMMRRIDQEAWSKTITLDG
jgi:[acyl-carrier-protein] S-malonyltransferase|mmetsp:Transcript_14037/g.31978  ORF Transcript_14037/g.31978 Transcript_14037/m.31978 type:complete len:471 (-) Transcript_14037:545-1957(-)|eukprot:CAMPEP_0119377182 /NCGR_PEP_ID=MMETSP1334-20130426/43525_1 /TAXON_ID=127549 /ORGANISM="Calcidiscus leptoporus, Strain RCC1130" /LENGTH=470 /DNA_ID=CAMNT_0007395997 /DNA_START=133 /DNA_END=1545 /DNA_ORIENTATION=+